MGVPLKRYRTACTSQEQYSRISLQLSLSLALSAWLLHAILTPSTPSALRLWRTPSLSLARALGLARRSAPCCAFASSQGGEERECERREQKGGEGLAEALTRTRSRSLFGGASGFRKCAVDALTIRARSVLRRLLRHLLRSEGCGEGCGVDGLRRQGERRGLGLLLRRAHPGERGIVERGAAEESSKILGGASQIVSTIRVICNGT